MKKLLSTNKFLASLSGLLVLASTMFSLTTSVTAHAAIDNTPDCDTVAIIKCGAFSESALKAAYDKNEYGDLKKVYDAFDISRSDMTGFVSGIVYRNGNVTVNGKVVATDAMTAGRNYGGTPIAGTKNVGKYSVSKFVDEGQTAFVKMKDGKFEFAIVKACSNPVSATPKETPKPKPAYSCDKLTAKKISRTEYEFTAKGTGKNGAEVTGYRFTLGDGTLKTQADAQLSHTYSKAGTYTVKAEVRVSIDDATKYKSGTACTVTVTVAKEPTTPTPTIPTTKKVKVCNPETGEIITVKESAANQYESEKNNACKDLRVCLLESKRIITIKQATFDESLHSKDLSDCDEETTTTTTPPVEEEQETPTPSPAPTAEVASESTTETEPEELPSTGPTEFVAGGLGLSSLTAAGYYVRASRRYLINKLLHRE